MKKILSFGMLWFVSISPIWANTHTQQLTPKDVENLATQALMPRSGYAYGEGHCYGFTAPKGWKLDNSLASLGVGMAFLPQNESWQSADIAMYTRSAAYENVDDQKMVTLQIADVQQMYKEDGQDIQAEHIQDIVSVNGEKGSLWRFSGYDRSSEELAAYFPAKPNLNYFIAQVGGSADKQAALQALIELAKSYHQRDECKPCKETGCIADQSAK